MYSPDFHSSPNRKSGDLRYKGLRQTVE